MKNQKMSIQSYFNQLKSLQIELKRLNLLSKKVRKEMNETKKTIAEYLREKDQPGVKYHGEAIILQQKPKRVYKTKKDKDEDAIRILEKYGISNPREALEEILDSRKGEEVAVEDIKIKRLDRLKK